MGTGMGTGTGMRTGMRTGTGMGMRTLSGAPPPHTPFAELVEAYFLFTWGSLRQAQGTGTGTGTGMGMGSENGPRIRGGGWFLCKKNQG